MFQWRSGDVELSFRGKQDLPFFVFLCRGYRNYATNPIPRFVELNSLDIVASPIIVETVIDDRLPLDMDLAYLPISEATFVNPFHSETSVTGYPPNSKNHKRSAAPKKNKHQTLNQILAEIEDSAKCRPDQLFHHDVLCQIFTTFGSFGGPPNVPGGTMYGVFFPRKNERHWNERKETDFHGQTV